MTDESEVERLFVKKTEEFIEQEVKRRTKAFMLTVETSIRSLNTIVGEFAESVKKLMTPSDTLAESVSSLNQTTSDLVRILEVRVHEKEDRMIV